MSKQSAGKVITFYSFKGGVGRSMALANVAALLAQRGKKVLVLDFDFEAPGLHRYFSNETATSVKFQRFDGESKPRGVLDFFVALRERLEQTWPESEGIQSAKGEEIRGLVDDVLTKEAFGHTVKIRRPSPKKKKKLEPVSLDFWPITRMDGSYVARVRDFEWQTFYARYAEVFPHVSEALSSRYEYVLLDSRTGVTDIGSICTMLLPEVLVLVFCPNDQSLRGALEVGRQAVEARIASSDLRPLPLFPLMSRIDNGEEELKRKWIETACMEFEELFRDIYDLDSCDLEAYFAQVQIPYRSFYAYGEKIAAEMELEDEADGLARVFAGFVECLSYGNPNEVPSKEERKELEKRAARREPESEEELRREVEENPEDGRVLMRYAGYLGDIGKFADAADAYAKAASRLEGEPGGERLAASAMRFQSNMLRTAGRFDASLGVLERIIGRYRTSEDASVRLVVALSMFERGILLRALGRQSEAIQAWCEVFENFEDGLGGGENEQNISMLRLVMQARVELARTFGSLERFAEALDVVSSVSDRLADTSVGNLGMIELDAALVRSRCFHGLGRNEEGVEAANVIVKKYAESDDPMAAIYVYELRVRSAAMLGEMERYDAAEALYRELASETETMADSRKSKVHGNFAFLRLCQAKQARAAGDDAKATQLLTHADELIREALLEDPEGSINLGNAAYIAFLQGRHDDARALLTKAIRLGGEKIRNFALKDSAIHPLPEDEAFREMVKSISITGPS